MIIDSGSTPSRLICTTVQVYKKTDSEEVSVDPNWPKELREGVLIRSKKHQRDRHTTTESRTGEIP